LILHRLYDVSSPIAVVTVKHMTHAFSIEMSSREHLQQISLSDKADTGVLVEGCLGDLKTVSLVDGVLLEIHGHNGILRLDITSKDLQKLFTNHHNNHKTGSDTQ
jgi:hypothetical protein